MVNLRSGSQTEAGPTCTGIEVNSSQKANVQKRSASLSRKAPGMPKTAQKSTRPTTRTLSRLLEKTEFLESPTVHTRSTGPVPAISLSTELPDFALEAAIAAAELPQQSGTDAADKRGVYGCDQQSPAEQLQGRDSTDLSDGDKCAEGTGNQAQQADLDVCTKEPGEGPESFGEAAHATGVGVLSPSIHTAACAHQSGPVSDADTAFTSDSDEEKLPEQEDDSQKKASMAAALDLPVASGHIEVEDSGLELDSDSDAESEDGPMGGLAASMWAALQKQRQRLQSTTEQKAHAGHGTFAAGLGLARKASNSRFKETQRSKAHAVEVPALQQGEKRAGEVVWQPETALPAPLQAEDASAGVRSAATEPGIAKLLMVAPRDKKHDAEAKKAEMPRDWHELPVTTITEEVKRDLRLLRLRGAMDTKRFYKKAERGKFPTRFAVGTIIEGPTEWYSGRMTKKQRKQTITEELLADPDLQKSRKRRFAKLQEEHSRWSHKKQKGSGPRLQKTPKRPKH